MNFPTFCFIDVLQAAGIQQFAKLKCMINYFRRILSEEPKGNVIFTRQVIDTFPNWSNSKLNFTNLVVEGEGKAIEDAKNQLQVDFANKVIGGGVLQSGCAQEEVRFSIAPECLVSLLFTEVLQPNEAVFITGAEQYCSYTGYGRTFTYVGDYVDTIDKLSDGTPNVTIVAIDAFPHMGGKDFQFSMPAIIRELNKAFTGFYSNTSKIPIATGNWGGGAFGGDPHLKFIIQLMATSQCSRDITYYTFGNPELLEDKLRTFHAKIRNQSISQVYSAIELYCKDKKSHFEHKETIIDFLFNYDFTSQQL